MTTIFTSIKNFILHNSYENNQNINDNMNDNINNDINNDINDDINDDTDDDYIENIELEFIFLTIFSIVYFSTLP